MKLPQHLTFLQYAKAALPEFECETRGNLSSLSFVATAADYSLETRKELKTKAWIFFFLTTTKMGYTWYFESYQDAVMYLSCLVLSLKPRGTHHGVLSKSISASWLPGHFKWVRRPSSALDTMESKPFGSHIKILKSLKFQEIFLVHQLLG